MVYGILISEHLDRIFSKLSKKDKLQFEILTRKINEIIENMSGQWRVHIRNFVLTYEILENERIIRLLDYAHHDEIYK